jgi:outer membrane protein
MGCTGHISDPLSLAPESSHSIWQKPSETKLISSRYIPTYIPEEMELKETSLAELIDIALMNNPSTKISWSEAKEKAARYGQSLSSYFPALDFRGSYSRQKGIPVTRTGFGYPTQEFLFAPLDDHFDFQSFYLTTVAPEIHLSYTIFDFGQRRASSEKARQALFYANYMHNRNIQSILLHVIERYYECAYQKELLLSLQECLETAEISLEAAKAKLHAGLSALGDVAKAKANLYQIKIALSKQKKHLGQSEASLLQVAGLPANMSCNIKPIPERVSTQAVLGSLDELIAKARKERPDFMAAQAKLDQQSENYKCAKAAYKPTIDGNFEIGKTWWSRNIDEDYHYAMEFSISFPLFRGFFFQNGVKKAKAKLEKSAAEFMQSELSLIKDVKVAYSQVESAKESYEFANEYYDSSLMQYEVTLENYKSGMSTMLDLLSAQSSLADAKTGLCHAKKEWFTAIAQMAYATGSLAVSKEETI